MPPWFTDEFAVVFFTPWGNRILLPVTFYCNKAT
jgi:hypothetical protein